MKRFKISALLLSTCLALGALAGCSQASAPAPGNGGDSAKADSMTAAVTNESETVRSVQVEGVASEISEVVSDDAKDTSASGATDSSAPSDTTPSESSATGSSAPDASAPDSSAPADENIDSELARQTYANTFVSAFAEQNISEIDIYNVSNEDLTDFVRILLKFHSTDLISYEPKGEMLFETFELSTAHDVIRDYFGVFITDLFTDRFAAPPEAHGDQPAGPYYEDGKIWYEAYDVEFTNRFAVVDSFTNNDDGTLTLTFTVYEAGPDADLAACYSLTPEEAAADSTLNIVTKGSAIVSVGQSGAYYMNYYKTE